ncbi:MAG: winged helix-turn-helix transcriptional regulator [Crenarchaeota archaeon]|nr:winged helix-turn-helix transcriptional regulator [Thermoproteota archaeon]
MSSSQLLIMLSPAGRILYALKNGPKNAEELLKETSLSKNTVYYHLKDLIHHGYVIKIGKGRYAITEKGLDILRKIIRVLSQ